MNKLGDEEIKKPNTGNLTKMLLKNGDRVLTRRFRLLIMLIRATMYQSYQISHTHTHTHAQWRKGNLAPFSACTFV